MVLPPPSHHPGHCHMATPGELRTAVSQLNTLKFLLKSKGKMDIRGDEQVNSCHHEY